MSAQERYWYNEEEADRVVDFWHSTFRHTDGIWAKNPFILEDWQEHEIIRPLFGWMRWDDQWGMWVRKYSRASIWLPRGNGKTPIMAGIILVGLVADGEEGAEVYGAAEDRDQASIVFRDVKRMVELSPRLRPPRLRINESAKRIIDDRTNSFYRALPRDELGEGSQGFRVHVAGVDEYHVQKGKGLVDALKKGMGKRVQPLFVTISTAGNDPYSPAAEDYRYAKRVAAGEIDDPGLFIYIREASEKDDPFDERTWHKANPALGKFLSIHTLREEAREAKNKPSELNDFLRFRLNIWTKQLKRRIPLLTWDEAGALDLLTQMEAQLAGLECWGGLDLASTQDVNALVWDFPDAAEPGHHSALFRFWIPEERVEDLDRRTDGQASVWVREGFLRTTPGNVTDYSAIEEQVREDGKLFRIQELGYDPWNSGDIVSRFEDAPFELVEIRQNFEQLAEPTKAWERLILERSYRHAGHPVMRWMVDNVIAQEDRNGNWKIDKRKSTEKVDGPVAAVMALKLARIGRRAEPELTYGTAGI